MATIVEMESGRLGYVPLTNLVRNHGKLRSPRGIKTYDLGYIVIVVHSPYDALPLKVGRVLNPAIAAAEAIQLIAGRANHDLLPRITPGFLRYAEPTGRFHGAYGDRVGSQVGAVVRKLHTDRDTRQAVITLWDPQLDNLPDRRDYPCTVALNFAIHNDLLELRTQMRSNDVWLGLPYDLFQFTQLQLTVARALNIEPGRYTHSTWSLHMYEDHAHLIDMLQGSIDPQGPYQPTGFGTIGDTWESCRSRANIALAGDTIHERRGSYTESELWYVEQLRPYLHKNTP